MPNLAVVQVIGHVGRDPESKQVGSNSVVEFSVAVNDGRKDAEHASWYRVSVWGKRGEPVARFVRKGSVVCVVGRLLTREFDGKNGRQTSLEIDASEVVFLDGKKQDEEAAF